MPSRALCRLPSGSKHGSHVGGGAAWAAAAGWTLRRALEPACAAEGTARVTAASTTAAGACCGGGHGPRNGGPHDGGWG